jgi:hypothetical protein
LAEQNQIQEQERRSDDFHFWEWVFGNRPEPPRVCERVKSMGWAVVAVAVAANSWDRRYGRIGTRTLR